MALKGPYLNPKYNNPQTNMVTHHQKIPRFKKNKEFQSSTPKIMLNTNNKISPNRCYNKATTQDTIIADYNNLMNPNKSRKQ
jgi:hypothetical protein